MIKTSRQAEEARKQQIWDASMLVQQDLPQCRNKNSRAQRTKVDEFIMPDSIVGFVTTIQR